MAKMRPIRRGNVAATHKSKQDSLLAGEESPSLASGVGLSGARRAKTPGVRRRGIAGGAKVAGFTK